VTWTKLSDTFAEELDAAGIEPEAFTLHVAALCYCNRLLTDGKFPVRKVKTLYPVENSDMAAKTLVNAGLWELIQQRRLRPRSPVPPGRGLTALVTALLTALLTPTPPSPAPPRRKG
jgi:hypothetical protein